MFQRKKQKTCKITDMAEKLKKYKILTKNDIMVCNAEF